MVEKFHSHYLFESTLFYTFKMFSVHSKPLISFDLTHTHKRKKKTRKKLELIYASMFLSETLLGQFNGY